MEDKRNFSKILLNEYKLYPKMQIQDMVKLIYQNEFAGGHMIENQEDSLDLLKRETKTLRKKYPDKMIPVVFKNIGNGLCRLYFSKVNMVERLDLETINNFFFNTANSVSGDVEKFEEKLEIFKRCCMKNVLPYPLDKVETYLKDYKISGYPPVSHSEEYRIKYSPSYRIVKDEYRHYFDIFQRISCMLKSEDSIKIAIDGNAGAGKSTLAHIIEEVYDCNVFHMDDFFLRPEQRTQERLKEIGGNVDYERFNREIMKALNKRIEFEYRPYNCKTMSLEEPIFVKPKKLNIIEGVYSMHPNLVDNYDIKVFLYIDEKQQSQRVLKRNGAIMHKRFIEEWIPMENEYFDEEDIISKVI